MLSWLVGVLALGLCTARNDERRHRNELLSREEQEALGIVWRGNASDSHARLESVAMPDNFNWCNKDGRNFCTMSRNQHIP
eukprot:CAMPEP_0195106454 /NCGR_PEP_ID=MMETSP0448-20130528/80806_1 /TAXON_ID=66468 /ORGANISM="Heterocapsa triquestra, Strain CCMP 448" /LENGTH=80 /DNA_ID=CAMNT_0040142715 /DNA_START=102 /DNA_END=341 /DNA_ORIENTATION=+